MLLFIACFVATLFFGIGLQHVKEEQYIGGNVAVLLHPSGFNQLFVKSVEVTGHVTRQEPESEGMFFLTPCDTLLVSSKQFSNKSLGVFHSPIPVIVSLNYFSTDEPILSQGDDGILMYYTTVQSNQSYSQCPAYISIFDNEMDYNNFRSGLSQKSTNQSTCLFPNFLSDDPTTALLESTFVLHSGHFYFALLSIEDGINVMVSMMATVTEYSVSHLHPLSCHLGYDKTTDDWCIFPLSNSSFRFFSHKQCLLGMSLSPYSAPYFSVSLVTTHINVETPWFIMLLITSCITLVAIVCFVVFLAWPYRKCRGYHRILY